MKLFILSHTLILIKKIKGNKDSSLVYFYYQSSNINCQKGNSYCEIAHIYMYAIYRYSLKTEAFAFRVVYNYKFIKYNLLNLSFSDIKNKILI